jgi:penicillin amidase
VFPLPGSPSIIIGFNDKMAWSETNTDADVLDWYSVKFRDQSRQEYFYNNEWKPVSKRIEVIKVRGGKDVTDTVIYTAQGPIVSLREPSLS